MSFIYQSIKRISAGLLGIMIAGLWLSTAGVAAEHRTGLQNTHIRKVAIRNIRPIGEGGSADANVRPEQVFDVVGSLNAVDGKQIVIGDRALTTAAGVSASGIAKWSQVGAKLNRAGEVVALEKITDQPH